MPKGKDWTLMSERNYNRNSKPLSPGVSHGMYRTANCFPRCMALHILKQSTFAEENLRIVRFMMRLNGYVLVSQPPRITHKPRNDWRKYPISIVTAEHICEGTIHVVATDDTDSR